MTPAQSISSASDVLICTSSLSHRIPMYLSRYLLIDVSTGTVLTAATCVLVADHDLSSSEWEELQSFSDSQICDIGKERGRQL